MEGNLNQVLNTKVEEIKKFAPNWYIFSQNGTLTDDEVEEFIKFDGMDTNDKITHFNTDGQTICEILIKLLNRVIVDRILQSVLLLLDNLIIPDFTVARHFTDMIKKVNYDIYSMFVNLLNKPDETTCQLSSRIVSKVITFGYHDFPESFAILYCMWLKKQLEIPANEYIYENLNACQLILRVISIRKTFYLNGLIQTLATILLKSSNFQIHYQVTFCLWLLAYQTELVDILIEQRVITIFSDILKSAQKTKVMRIILATCRNMVDRSDHPNNILSLFVYNKFIYILQLMQKTVPEDDDMADDLKYLLDLLLKNVQDLSTFDEYAGELLNGRLEWTPVHKSEKFWRENAQRLCEKNHELILVLINTINNSTDSIALAVACHDLGEFVRFYSRGKLILQEYGIIEKIMTLLYHTDPNTKYEALISLQKIMIHNWDFLGKQLSSGENSSKNEVSSS